MYSRNIAPDGYPGALLAFQFLLLPNPVLAADDLALVLRQTELRDDPADLRRFRDERDPPLEQFALERDYPFGPRIGRFTSAIGNVGRLDERSVALGL